ncbi:cytochrome bc complex cytochrome b subunit [Micromonospora sp. NPDC049679]|uniref:cytochrome bc1 complex cytochrome b subunit n=1 Tax=Micromonospora sp. NPDC049679 TaxID=3155920 RepID=UPI0033FB8B3E
MITRRLVRALDERLGTTPIARTATAKVFPDHWSFMLGEIALYCFTALVLTGVYLTLFFEPSTAQTTYSGSFAPLRGEPVSAAYASTVALSFDVRAGLLIRQTHHWAALLFVGAIVLHLMRIFFTGAFRKPRELNWLVGVTMLALALANGFTGYSLPDDLLSGVGLRIIYSVVQSVPLVGAELAFLAFGGEFPAAPTIPRMFITHVLLVPGALATLIALHLAMVIRQKHSQFAGPGRTEQNVVGSRFWPSYTVRTLALFAWILAVLFGLGGLVQINPVWIYGPFDPAQATSPAQPDWYVLWGDGALRLFPPIEFRVFGYLVPGPFLPGAALGGLTFLALYAWPFLEARRARDPRPHQLLGRPRDHPLRLGVGVGALTFFTLLTVTAADDIIARLLRIPVTGLLAALQVLVLTVPWLAGLVGFLVARALRANGGVGIAALTRADVRVALTRRPPAQPDAAASPHDRQTAGVEVWQQADGDWRWRYVDPRAPDLTGNRAFPSRGAAVDAARTAYPGRTIRSIRAHHDAAREASDAARTMGRRVGTVATWTALLAIGILRRRRQRR